MPSMPLHGACRQSSRLLAKRKREEDQTTSFPQTPIIRRPDEQTSTPEVRKRQRSTQHVVHPYAAETIPIVLSASKDRARSSSRLAKKVAGTVEPSRLSVMYLSPKPPSRRSLSTPTAIPPCTVPMISDRASNVSVKSAVRLRAASFRRTLSEDRRPVASLRGRMKGKREAVFRGFVPSVERAQTQELHAAHMSSPYYGTWNEQQSTSPSFKPLGSSEALIPQSISPQAWTNSDEQRYVPKALTNLCKPHPPLRTRASCDVLFGLLTTLALPLSNPLIFIEPPESNGIDGHGKLNTGHSFRHLLVQSEDYLDYLELDDVEFANHADAIRYGVFNGPSTGLTAPSAYSAPEFAENNSTLSAPSEPALSTIPIRRSGRARRMTARAAAAAVLREAAMNDHHSEHTTSHPLSRPQFSVSPLCAIRMLGVLRANLGELIRQRQDVFRAFVIQRWRGSRIGPRWMQGIAEGRWLNTNWSQAISNEKRFRPRVMYGLSPNLSPRVLNSMLGLLNRDGLGDILSKRQREAMAEWKFGRRITCISDTGNEDEMEGIWVPDSARGEGSCGAWTCIGRSNETKRLAEWQECREERSYRATMKPQNVLAELPRRATDPALYATVAFQNLNFEELGQKRTERKTVKEHAEASSPVLDYIVRESYAPPPPPHVCAIVCHHAPRVPSKLRISLVLERLDGSPVNDKYLSWSPISQMSGVAPMDIDNSQSRPLSLPHYVQRCSGHYPDRRSEPPVWKWANLNRVEQSCQIYGFEWIRALVASEAASFHNLTKFREEKQYELKLKAFDSEMDGSGLDDVVMDGAGEDDEEEDYEEDVIPLGAEVAERSERSRLDSMCKPNGGFSEGENFPINPVDTSSHAPTRRRAQPIADAEPLSPGEISFQLEVHSPTLQSADVGGKRFTFRASSPPEPTKHGHDVPEKDKERIPVSALDAREQTQTTPRLSLLPALCLRETLAPVRDRGTPACGGKAGSFASSKRRSAAEEERRDGRREWLETARRAVAPPLRTGAEINDGRTELCQMQHSPNHTHRFVDRHCSLNISDRNNTDSPISPTISSIAPPSPMQIDSRLVPHSSLHLQSTEEPLPEHLLWGLAGFSAGVGIGMGFGIGVGMGLGMSVGVGTGMGVGMLHSGPEGFGSFDISSAADDGRRISHASSGDCIDARTTPCAITSVPNSVQTASTSEFDFSSISLSSEVPTQSQFQAQNENSNSTSVSTMELDVVIQQGITDTQMPASLGFELGLGMNSQYNDVDTNSPVAGPTPIPTPVVMPMSSPTDFLHVFGAGIEESSSE